MSPIYTHTFDFKFGGDGISFTMKGDCEFNVDEESSFKTDEALSNLTVDQLGAVEDLFRATRGIYKKFGNITKLKIMTK